MIIATDFMYLNKVKFDFKKVSLQWKDGKYEDGKQAFFMEKTNSSLQINVTLHEIKYGNSSI